MPEISFLLFFCPSFFCRKSLLPFFVCFVCCSARGRARNKTGWRDSQAQESLSQQPSSGKPVATAGGVVRS